MSAGEAKVVCVTGGSGYIASWLIKFLLQRGYTVKATVRDPNDPKKTEHLLALDGAKERLHLFKANLLEKGSFDAVVDGCDGVFHTASPVAFTATDPETEIIDPAVKGTLNVLKSCAKFPSIKRVIFTSSIAACIYSGKPLNRDVIVDETWYSDPAICKESGDWYPLAKTLVEEAARNFAKENAIDLVLLNPTFVIGPLLQPTLCLTVEMILGLVNGSLTYPNESYSCIDVRDVSRAHIQAFEIPSASGRYCLVETVTEFEKVLKIILELYPTLQIPENNEARKIYFPCFEISKERSKSLGLNMIPLEETIRDTTESLKEKGFLKI